MGLKNEKKKHNNFNTSTDFLLSLFVTVTRKGAGEDGVRTRRRLPGE